MAGNPSILSQPYDMNNQPCGSSDHADYPYIYFPTPKTIKKNVCVASCPTKNGESVKCLKNSLCKTGTLSTNTAENIVLY